MGFGGRKFIISMASIVAVVVLAAVERMTGDVAVVLTAVNVGYLTISRPTGCKSSLYWLLSPISAS